MLQLADINLQYPLCIIPDVSCLMSSIYLIIPYILLLSSLTSSYCLFPFLHISLSLLSCILITSILMYSIVTWIPSNRFPFILSDFYSCFNSLFLQMSYSFYSFLPFLSHLFPVFIFFCLPNLLFLCT